MGEKPGTSESDVFDSELSCSSFASLWRPIKCSFGGLEVPGVGLSPSPARLAVRLLVLIVILGTVSHSTAHGDALERIRHSGRLLYGSDMEGGGPYAYPDPRSPRDVTGFEVELMGLLAKDLGATPEFSQGQWDKLLQVLDAGRLDLVCNGYEWTETRARDYLATRPYYVYQLQLMARRGSSYRSWADLKQPKPGGGRWTVGVLVASAADTFAAEQGGPHVEVVRFDGATDAMTAVQNGQYDTTLQDVPAARFYHERFPASSWSARRNRTVITSSTSGRPTDRCGTRSIRAWPELSRRENCGGSTKSMGSGLTPRPSCRQ